MKGKRKGAKKKKKEREKQREKEKKKGETVVGSVIVKTVKSTHGVVAIGRCRQRSIIRSRYKFDGGGGDRFSSAGVANTVHGWG